MRVLFIKLKHIGDALLLTPTVTAVKASYPDAEIWVVVRSGTEGILAGCSAIDRVLTAAAAETDKRSSWSWLGDARLALSLRRVGFDHAFELSDGDRGRWLVSLSGARTRTANAAGAPLNWWWRRRFNSFSHFRWHEAHAVERDYFTVHDALPLPLPVPPVAFARAAVGDWEPAAGLKDFVVLHPGTRWVRKRWPLDRWVAVATELAAGGAKIVISAGPNADEMREAAELEQALAGRALNAAGRLTWAQLAGLLYRARLFVGVDTAAMHLAAACQTPVVGLFGPSDERVWHPWQARHELVSPPGGDRLRRLMTDIRPDQVAAACQRMLE